MLNLMKLVMCFGTFDYIHPGHLFYLRESKKEGDKLMVVVARDQNVKKIKGKAPKYNESQRLQHIKELKFVDKAVLGNEHNDCIKIIEDYLPDIICLGYDQDTVNFHGLKEELEKRRIKAEVVRIPAFRPNIYKSSKIK